MSATIEQIAEAALALLAAIDDADYADESVATWYRVRGWPECEALRAMVRQAETAPAPEERVLP